MSSPAYRDFEDRVNIASKKMTSKEMVMNAVNQKIGKFTKSDIMEYCPEIKSRTIESALKELCDDGVLSIERKGRSTFYYRNN